MFQCIHTRVRFCAFAYLLSLFKHWRYPLNVFYFMDFHYVWKRSTALLSFVFMDCLCAWSAALCVVSNFWYYEGQPSYWLFSPSYMASDFRQVSAFDVFYFLDFPWTCLWHHKKDHSSGCLFVRMVWFVYARCATLCIINDLASQTGNLRSACFPGRSWLHCIQKHVDFCDGMSFGAQNVPPTSVRSRSICVVQKTYHACVCVLFYVCRHVYCFCIRRTTYCCSFGTNCFLDMQNFVTFTMRDHVCISHIFWIPKKHIAVLVWFFHYRWQTSKILPCSTFRLSFACLLDSRRMSRLVQCCNWESLHHVPNTHTPDLSITLNVNGLLVDYLCRVYITSILKKNCVIMWYQEKTHKKTCLFGCHVLWQ